MTDLRKRDGAVTEPTFDLSHLDVERFAHGNARAELNVI